MTFRKDSFLYYEMKSLCGMMILLSCILIPTIGITISILCAIPFVIILLTPALYNERITINENGIVCTKSETELWRYDWRSIAMLKKSKRFRLPSVEIILYSETGELEPYGASDRYFQLGKKAKQALELYQKKLDTPL